MSPIRTTTGSIKAVATTRGTTRYSTGSTAMVRNASTCSVTTMVPISAAIAEPARPATISEASTGTISLVSANATTGPTKLGVP